MPSALVFTQLRPYTFSVFLVISEKQWSTMTARHKDKNWSASVMNYLSLWSRSTWLEIRCSEKISILTKPAQLSHPHTEVLSCWTIRGGTFSPADPKTAVLCKQGSVRSRANAHRDPAVQHPPAHHITVRRGVRAWHTSAFCNFTNTDELLNYKDFDNGDASIDKNSSFVSLQKKTKTKLRFCTHKKWRWLLLQIGSKA